MWMKIAITGYYGTGSSAVLNLLEEYSTAGTGISYEYNHGYEHVPFYVPGGLFDLEWKLLYCNNVHRSTEAIETFSKAMKRLEKNFVAFGSYRKMYGNAFAGLTDQFLKEITDFRRNTCSYSDYELVSSWKYYCRDLVKKFLRMEIYGNFGTRIRRNLRECPISFVSEEEFFQAARSYVAGYLEMVGPKDKKDWLFDHLLFPQDAIRVEKYFPEDFRLIIVDRDIRDMFVLNKYIWKGMGFTSSVYPEDPKEFARFWKRMRATEKRVESDRVLYVQFEDLIYRYEETVKKIEAFTGLKAEDHLNPKTRLVPEKSIENTQNFRMHPEWEKECRIFKELVPEAVYSFPYVYHADESKVFDDISETE